MPADDLTLPAGPLARVVERTGILEDELLLLPALVPWGGVCLDIGAAFGIYTGVLARLVGPRGTVHAVEPQPAHIRNLGLLRRALGLRQVRLHRLALADRQGELRLVLPRRRLRVRGRAYLWDGDGDPHAYPDEFRGVDTYRVPVTSLDALAARLALPRLDFVKADVEGAELRLLRGAEATIARHRPVLLVEIEERHTAKYGSRAADVFAWLAARRYGAAALIGRAVRPVDGVVPGVRNYLFRSAAA